MTEDGPTDAEHARLTAITGLYWRTCDQCASQGVCLVVGDGYICEACIAFHERALDAAHDAIRATSLTPTLRDHDVDRIAWAAVKAYTEFTDDAADLGSESS